MSRQGGLVASMTLLSRISGLARDIVLSYLFGASAVADMFFVAFRIPNFFRRLFAEGAFNQAFVPVLVRYRERGTAQLLGFIAPLSGLFGASLALAVLLGVVFAPAMTYLFAPGFASEPGKLDETTALVRLTFPYLGFISLLELPVGLVAVALGTVMLPHLSRMAAQGDPEKFRQTVDWGVNLGLLLGLPAAVALYLLAEPLIATLFMSFSTGAMTPYDVRMAGIALEMFAIALPGFVLVKILAPAFFAHEDTRSPFRYASVAIAVNLIASLATFSWFGHVGLAWATALSAWTHVILLYWGLKHRGHYIAGRNLLPMMWKTLLACALLALALLQINQSVAWMSLSSGERLAMVAVVSGGGIAGYLCVLGMLGLRPRHLRHRSG